MLSRISSRNSIAAMLAAPVLLAAGGTASAADEAFSLSATFAIPGNPATNPGGGFASADISFIDSEIGLWMMADRTNRALDVIDLNFNTVHQIIPTGASAFQGARVRNGATDNEISGPNGVVTVNSREAWVSDAPTGNVTGVSPNQVFTPTGGSTVKVINLRTQQVTDVLDTGGNHRADEVAFDPDDQVFIVANPADEPTPFVTLFSTKPGHKLLKKIFLDGKNGRPLVTPDNGIEQPAYSPRTGLFYVALPVLGNDPNVTNVGGVMVIDPRGDADDIRVVETFKIFNCTPQGVALGPNFEAFLGCNAVGRTTIIDIRNGQEVLSVPQLAGGCDEVWYNPGDNHFFGACNQGAPANGAINALGSIDAGRGHHSLPRFDSNVATKPNNNGGNIHSLAADAFTNRVFVALPRAAVNNDICAAAGSSNGCIAVFTTTNDDPPFVEEEDHDHDRGRR